jgi:hypothetical protein
MEMKKLAKKALGVLLIGFSVGLTGAYLLGYFDSDVYLTPSSINLNEISPPSNFTPLFEVRHDYNA